MWPVGGEQVVSSALAMGNTWAREGKKRNSTSFHERTERRSLHRLCAFDCASHFHALGG